jgi:TRAP-type C4-dicarboxylate transport system substrate-binding protein
MLAVLPFISACAEPATPEPAPAPAPAPTPAPAEPIVLTFSTLEPEVAFREIKVIQPWFAEIEEATGGRVKIQPYYAESLVPMPDTYDAIVKGTVDIGESLTPFQTVAKFVMDDVMYLSRYDTLCWRPSRVYWELYQSFPELQAEYADTKYLFPASLMGSAIGLTKKPVRTLEDLKGLKLIAPGRVTAMKAEALGFIPVGVPPTGYSEMEKGVVDGTVACEPDLLWSFRFGDVVHYLIPVVFIRGAFFCAMNLEKFNSLPPDIQKIINDLSGEHMVDRYDREYALNYKDCLERAPKEFDIEIIQISPEELARWNETEKVVEDAFAAELEAKGLPGRELVDEQLRLEKKYAAAEYEPK